MEVGMIDSGIFKNPNKPMTNNSLEVEQLVQPPGFHYVHLGQQLSFPNFVLHVDGSWG